MKLGFSSYLVTNTNFLPSSFEVFDDLLNKSYSQRQWQSLPSRFNKIYTTRIDLTMLVHYHKYLPVSDLLLMHIVREHPYRFLLASFDPEELKNLPR